MTGAGLWTARARKGFRNVVRSVILSGVPTGYCHDNVP